MRRIAVVGGGLSGLAAAHRLIESSAPRAAGSAQAGQSPLEVTLFEAGPRLGGVVGTERRDGYLVERGADSFITNKPWGIDLCRRLGLEGELIGTDPAYRRSLVLRAGKPVEVPDGFLLLAPAKIGPILTTPLLSLRGKARLGLEYFIPRRRDGGQDESLASFVRRRFGREVFERIVQPLVGGIYTADPEKLSLRATLPRFLDWERDYGSLIRAARRDARQRNTQGGESGARYGLFATLAGGLSRLIDTLAERIAASGRIRLGTRIEKLAPLEGGAGFECHPADGPAEQFDAVVLALPAYRAAELARPFNSQLAEPLGEIEYASSAIVVTGHALADVRHPLKGAGLVIPATERRDVLAVSFASRKFPGRAPEGRVLLRSFVGGALQPELLERSDDELVALVRRELGELLGVGGKEDFALVARYPRAMPQYHVGHLDRVARIATGLESHPRLALAGNALHGVGLPDCIHSGEEAAERILAAASRR